MDTRGQGGTWSTGDTPDLYAEGGSPQFPGSMTKGILDPKHYFYRRVFTDAVRAIETARSHEAVDATQIAVTGGSQGGGITIAAAGLVPDVVVAMPDVPFLCHYRRATEISDGYPYKEIAEFCHAQRDKIDVVFNTLSYFDGVNFATRAKAKGFILHRFDGSNLPALHSLCRVQSLGQHRKAYQSLSLQRSRRRRHVSNNGEGQVLEENLEVIRISAG